MADLGSFRKAADRLNTTQPNISARIAALESALDLSLMHRDAGSVRLTEKGSELLLLTRDILRAGEALLEAAHSIPVEQPLTEVLRAKVMRAKGNTQEADELLRAAFLPCRRERKSTQSRFRLILKKGIHACI